MIDSEIEIGILGASYGRKPGKSVRFGVKRPWEARRMTRTEVIDSLATRTGMEKKAVKDFLDHLVALVDQEMRAGGEVPLKGLGKFKVQHRKARVGRNPLTGEEIQIPAKTVAKFTLAKTLKDLVK